VITAIVFDWGRTLYDSEREALFPEVPDLVPRLARDYRLAIVSLVTGDYAARVAARSAALRDSGLEAYFSAVHFVSVDKDAAYVEALAELGVSPTTTAIIDDRVRRGIAWGNQHGATTVWLRRGRFANELPDAATGEPTYTIAAIGELAALFLADQGD
jgi:FMN phosphatase YigB (HAD superfamily)